MKKILFIFVVLFIVINYQCEVKDKQFTLIQSANNSYLVNLDYSLNKDYIPKDLITIHKQNAEMDIQINKTVYDNFMKMKKDLNLNCNIISAYRSYNYQEDLYKKELKTDSNLLSVMPQGYSEHQTGLALDISINDILSDDFMQTADYQLIKDYGYKYGFVIRYEKNKSKYTGVIDESWHLRYLDKEVALYLHKNNLCLEELYLNNKYIFKAIIEKENNDYGIYTKNNKTFILK